MARLHAMYFVNQFFAGIGGEEKAEAAVGFREVPVKTGLRGSDGNVVIESGLSEGEKVIIFLNGN